MSLPNICIICLKYECKLYEFSKNNYLAVFYNELCDEPLTHSNTMHLCSHCAFLLKKFYNFKQKCNNSQDTLKQYYDSGQELNDIKAKSTSYLNYWTGDRNKIITHTQTNGHDKFNNYIDTEVYISFVKQEDNKFDNTENVKVENNDSEEVVNIAETEVKTDDESNDDIDDYSPLIVFAKEESNEDNTPDSEQVTLEPDIVEKKRTKQKMKQKNRDKMEDLNIDKLSIHKRRKLLRQIKEKPNLTANDKQLLFKLDKRYKPLKELETDFDIQMYLTEDEQLEEFLKRKTDDSYVKSEFQCQICFRGFKEMKLLDTHSLKHQVSAGEYICKICNIRCLTSKLHRTHRDSNHTAKYTCKSCSFVTYSKAQARKHQSWHEGVVHTCQHCQMSFRKHTTLLSHLRLLHPSPHICSVCARSFVSANGLRQHKSVAHKEQNVDDKEGARCEDCDITFATRNVYIRHVLVTPKHADLAKCIIGCTVCGEQFENREDLEQHSHKGPKRPEDKVKDLKCSECGDHFTHSSSLYHHFVKAHPSVPYKLAGSRHFLCETCGRTFNCAGSLGAHARSHSGERPYACTSCDKRFRTKQTRDKHATRHELTRRHACRICGNLYSNKTNLFRHKQVHSGVRKHRCDMCDKSFVDGSNLRQHVQGVHYNIRRVRKR